MCRWIAYSGEAIALQELVIKPEISLIDQSLSAQMAAERTNGDGFGVGWFEREDRPGLYRSVRPAWNDENLLDLARHIRSHLFLAHVRSSTGTAIQRSNCHPFRNGRWLFAHNGEVEDFRLVRRDLIMAIDPALVPYMQGSTDSELLFLLALTLGLESRPLEALESMAGLVEELGRERGIEHPLRMTLGLADGESLIAVRYSSDGRSGTLFYGDSREALRALYPEHPRVADFPDDARVIVSEPLSDVPQVWIEIPESTALVCRGGEIDRRPFEPRAP